MKTEELVKELKEQGITNVQFHWIGLDMPIRVKASHIDHLQNCIRSGIGVARAINSMNLLDRLVHGGLVGPESSEYRIVPDIETYASMPYLPGSGRFICELYETDMTPSKMDSRYFLKKILQKAREMGYVVMVACETEFNVFKKDNGRIFPAFSEKYGSPDALVLADSLLREWISSLNEMNVKVERFLKEYGPSQFEIQMKYADALKAADDMLTLRIVSRGVAAKHGLHATFLPKPTPYIGSGMHLHISLWDIEKKRNLFYDQNDKRGLDLSSLAYNFIGGLLRHMRPICLLGAPLVNSYKRLLDGVWAPSRIFYGADHRDAAIRVPSPSIPGDENSIRIEYRVPDPSANPYLAVGSAVAAGLDGVLNQIEPGEPIVQRIFELSEEERERLGVGPDKLLPRTLGEAIMEMKKSAFVKEMVGEPLFHQYILNRESEWKDFREHVTDWEVYNFIDCV